MAGDGYARLWAWVACWCEYDRGLPFMAAVETAELNDAHITCRGRA